jgi:iron complex transport system ATP-binding protein
MIDVTGLGFRYGQTWVFRDINFSLQAGEIAAVLGPNGRGKTTLLKSVMGLLQPDTGSVRLRGRPGYVAQRAEIAFAYTVIDIVVMGRAAHVGMFSAPGKKHYQHARQALAQLNLEHLADQHYNRLSGGERQLVMIARALASECQVLILDEPASALDFRNQDLVLSTLLRLAKELDLAILMTTHFPQHAVHIADYALMMQAVDEAQWGPAEHMLSEDNLEQLFGVPVKKIQIEAGEKNHTGILPLFSH